MLSLVECLAQFVTTETKRVSGTQNVPRVIQWDNYSCYARCVMSVLRHYQRPADYARVRKALKTKPGGTYECYVLPYLRRHQLSATVRVNLSIPALRRELEQGSAVIAYVDDDKHVLVVYGLDDTYAYVSEPAITQTLFTKIPKQTLLARWTRRSVIVRDKQKPR